MIYRDIKNIIQWKVQHFCVWGIYYGQEVTPEEHIAEDGSVYYTYTFKNINKDNLLHVEWEPCEYHIDYDANGGEITLVAQWRKKEYKSPIPKTGIE